MPFTNLLPFSAVSEKTQQRVSKKKGFQQQAAHARNVVGGKYLIAAPEAKSHHLGMRKIVGGRGFYAKKAAYLS